MSRVIFNAKNGETTFVEVAESDIPQVEEYIEQPTREEEINDLKKQLEEIQHKLANLS